jgi:hypothetical protein
MKNFIIVFLSLVSISALAAEVEGTLMLKGALKSKVVVNGVSSVCKLKIDKVKNLLEEDDFGNPGYQVQIEIELDGRDIERKIKIKLDKKLTVINMHTANGVRQVKDLDYFSTAEKVTVTIDKEGRLVSTSFPYSQQIVKCSF